MEADPESCGIATIHPHAMFDMQCSNPPTHFGLKAMKDICLVDLWVFSPLQVFQLLMNYHVGATFPPHSFVSIKESALGGTHFALP